MAKIQEWMIVHKWMTDYTPQTEWIERKGILVWIAEVCTSIGSGLYLISLFFSLVPGYEKISWWGMLVAWLVIMFLKIPLHLIYFGKPLRFWRTIPPFSSAWKTSWFARGIIFSILFGTFAFIQLVFSYLTLDVFNIGLQFSADVLVVLSAFDILFKVLGGIFAFLTGIYPGFIMNYVKAIQFWNSGLLPVVLIMGGILDGCALLMAIGLTPAGAGIDGHTVELVSTILLIVNIFFIAVYLLSATYIGTAGKVSTMKLLKGSQALVFWLGVIILGMIIPLAISLYTLSFGASVTPLLILAIFLHTIGAFALKYCILKVAIYRPLFTVNVGV
jgi:formate-dependent nitrite reductase membrane component NrfD